MPQDSVQPLIDRFGRVHDSIRLSVTDRCNIRCFYCMPETDAHFMPRDWLLTFEELHRLAELLVRRTGVRDIRLTGGEPLVRKELTVLIKMLSEIDGIEDLSMTTNGILLAEHAAELRAAGLRRVNVSLDTLDEASFQKISRRKGVDKVIAGIDAAIDAGFDAVKLNTIAIRGITEPEVIRLVKFAERTKRSAAVHRIHAAGYRQGLAIAECSNRRRIAGDDSRHLWRITRAQPTAPIPARRRF